MDETKSHGDVLHTPKGGNRPRSSSAQQKRRRSAVDYDLAKLQSEGHKQRRTPSCLLVLSHGSKAAAALQGGSALALSACGLLKGVTTVVGVGTGNIVASAMNAAWNHPDAVSVRSNSSGPSSPSASSGSTRGDDTRQTDDVREKAKARKLVEAELRAAVNWEDQVLTRCEHFCCRNLEAEALWVALRHPWMTLTSGWHPALHTSFQWPLLLNPTSWPTREALETQKQPGSQPHSRSRTRVEAKGGDCEDDYTKEESTELLRSRSTTANPRKIDMHNGHLPTLTSIASSASVFPAEPVHRSRPTSQTGSVAYDSFVPSSASPVVWHVATTHSPTHPASSAVEWHWRQKWQPFHLLPVHWTPVAFRWSGQSHVAVDGDSMRWVEVESAVDAEKLLSAATIPSCFGAWDYPGLPAIVNGGDQDPLGSVVSRRLCNPKTDPAFVVPLETLNFEHTPFLEDGPQPRNPDRIILLDAMYATKPAHRLSEQTKITCQEFRRWVVRYNMHHQSTSSTDAHETMRTRRTSLGVPPRAQRGEGVPCTGVCSYTSRSSLRAVGANGERKRWGEDQFYGDDPDFDDLLDNGAGFGDEEDDESGFHGCGDIDDDLYRWVARFDHRLEALPVEAFQRLVNWGFIQLLLLVAPTKQTLSKAKSADENNSYTSRLSPILVPTETVEPPVRQQSGRAQLYFGDIHTHMYSWNPKYTLPFPGEATSQLWQKGFVRNNSF